MGYQIKFVLWNAGIASDAITLTDRWERLDLAAAQGNGVVQSKIALEGNYDYATTESNITLFNRHCELIAPMAESGRRPAWANTQQRFAIAVRQETSHGSGSWNAWWYSDLVGGIAVPDPRHFDEGLTQNKGYCTFQFAHRPVWYRDPVAIALSNARSGQSYPGGTGWLTLDNETGSAGTDNVAGFDAAVSDPGDAPCLVDLRWRNPVNDGAHTPSRVYVGMLKGSRTFTSRIGTFSQTAVAGNSWTYSTITLSASDVPSATLQALWAGFCRPMLLCDAVMPSNLEAMVVVSRDGQAYDGDQQWWPLESGRSVHALPTVRVPVSPISTQPTAVQLVLRVRNLGTSSANFPAGKLHIFPCDGWAAFDTSAWPVAYQQVLTSLNSTPVDYIDTGSAGKFDTVVHRGEQMLVTPEQSHCFVVCWERSTGLASHTSTGELKLSLVPRRRSI